MNQDAFPLPPAELDHLAIKYATPHFNMIADEKDVTQAAQVVAGVMEDPSRYGHQFDPYSVTFDDNGTDFHVQVKRGRSKLYVSGKTKQNDRNLSRTILTLCTQAIKNEYNL